MEIKKIVFLFFIITIISSCSKTKHDVSPSIDYSYAGLELGKYVIYDVDSFFYDDFDQTIDTSYYQIKEVVDSKFIDLEGEEAFKIIRYRKENDTTNWVLIDVWNSKITATNFQKVEENNRFVKLIFPVKENKTWNGNSMNNLGNMEYEFILVDNLESIGGNSLNDVLTVVQYEDLTNFINPILLEEKYAKGIGMVYKKRMSKVRGSLSGPWLGYDVTMTLSSYGG